MQITALRPFLKPLRLDNFPHGLCSSLVPAVMDIDAMGAIYLLILVANHDS